MTDILQFFGTVIKSLFKKSACDMYPVKPAKFYDRTKGHIEIDAPKCILCTLCDRQCPTGAIKVDREKRTWEIDYHKCILCNNCIDACRPGCLKMANQYASPELAKKTTTVNIPEKGE